MPLRAGCLADVRRIDDRSWRVGPAGAGGLAWAGVVLGLALFLPHPAWAQGPEGRPSSSVTARGELVKGKTTTLAAGVRLIFITGRDRDSWSYRTLKPEA